MLWTLNSTLHMRVRPQDQQSTPQDRGHLMNTRCHDRLQCMPDMRSMDIGVTHHCWSASCCSSSMSTGLLQALVTASPGVSCQHMRRVSGIPTDAKGQRIQKHARPGSMSSVKETESMPCLDWRQQRSLQEEEGSLFPCCECLH